MGICLADTYAAHVPALHLQIPHARHYPSECVKDAADSSLGSFVHTTSRCAAVTTVPAEFLEEKGQVLRKLEAGCQEADDLVLWLLDRRARWALLACSCRLCR